MGLIANYNAYVSDTDLSIDESDYSWAYTSGDIVDVPIMSRQDGLLLERSMEDYSKKTPVLRDLRSINSIVLHSSTPSGFFIRTHFAIEAIKIVCNNLSVSDFERQTSIHHILYTLTSSWPSVLNSRYGKDRLLARAFDLSADDLSETVGKMGLPPLMDLSDSARESDFFFRLITDITSLTASSYGSDFFNKVAGMSRAYALSRISRRKGCFFIDWAGIVYQTSPLNLVPIHLAYGDEVRSDLSRLSFDRSLEFNGIDGSYSNEARYKYWSDFYPSLSGVLDLPAWSYGGVETANPNLSSVGVYLLSPSSGSYGTPTSYTDAQYQSLARLVNRLIDDGSMSIERSSLHVTGHKYVDPIAKPNVSPSSNFDWDRFYSDVSIVS